MKIRITDVIDWYKDDAEMAGDCSHMPLSEVLFKEAEETAQKVERSEWPGIPFVCDADGGESAMDKYIREHCYGDYIIPSDVQWEAVGSVTVEARNIVWGDGAPSGLPDCERLVLDVDGVQGEYLEDKIENMALNALGDKHGYSALCAEISIVEEDRKEHYNENV